MCSKPSWINLKILLNKRKHGKFVFNLQKQINLFYLFPYNVDKYLFCIFLHRTSKTYLNLLNFLCNPQSIVYQKQAKNTKKKSSLQAKWSETQKSTFTKIYWNYENSPCLFCFYEKGCQSIGKSLKNNNKISAKNREKLRNYSLLLRVSVEFGKSSKKSYSLNFCFRYNSPLLNISLKHFCFV